jgi:hypothetical protein
LVAIGSCEDVGCFRRVLRRVNNCHFFIMYSFFHGLFFFLK